MTDTRSEQMDFWLKIGIFKQQTQQLEYKREKGGSGSQLYDIKNLKKENDKIGGGGCSSGSLIGTISKEKTKNQKIQSSMMSSPNKKLAGPASVQQTKNIIMRRKSSVTAKFPGKSPTETVNNAMRRRLLALKGL